MPIFLLELLQLLGKKALQMSRLEIQGIRWQGTTRSPAMLFNRWLHMLLKTYILYLFMFSADNAPFPFLFFSLFLDVVLSTLHNHGLHCSLGSNKRLDSPVQLFTYPIATACQRLFLELSLLYTYSSKSQYKGFLYLNIATTSHYPILKCTWMIKDYLRN